MRGQPDTRDLRLSVTGDLRWSVTVPRLTHCHTQTRGVCLSFFPAVVDCQTSFSLELFINRVVFFSHNKTASANLLATETITGTRRELVYQLKR
jgi:hypothetical protein